MASKERFSIMTTTTVSNGASAPWGRVLVPGEVAAEDPLLLDEPHPARPSGGQPPRERSRGTREEARGD